MSCTDDTYASYVRQKIENGLAILLTCALFVPPAFAQEKVANDVDIPKLLQKTLPPRIGVVQV